MRVLFQSLQASNRSGTGSYTVELLKSLAVLEDGPELVCLWPKEVYVPAGCETVKWLQYPSSLAARLYLEQWATSRLARKYGSDLVHFPASVGTLLHKVPAVVTVHDLCYKIHPEWFPRTRVLYYNAFVGAGIRNAARIIADSQATADDILRFYDIPASRVDIIPLGVESRFHPANETDLRRVQERYHLPESYFLFAGTLEPRKNLPRVLEAWSSLGDVSPELVIAGRTGWKTDLTRFIKDKGYAQHRIHCLGYVPPEFLPALYSGARAFVWPSLMEGFGLPPLEAMACGAPVITANTSSLPEVVGEAALTVAPTDVPALAGAMACLAGDARMCKALREAGLQRAALFTWNRTAEMTVDVYKRVRPKTV
ncbi:MAG: D-inositol 3-phosphate glycosyltransferase [Candidatus Hydrogenedentes bacterium ADurb.Bin101]|jgi:glycosyltransferase involved in cell wall biosynthesis|nr:MAG: D-inositol 3-phosphate glycosyltransferase [Candidatus Hydrogenedentes bacterium ADurb.Bin101]HOC68432.1 glycosyltransferase family 1 protein [Candidatus Hydrogenedentota bacterium]